MSPSWQSTTGIILCSTPFEEQQFITTIFTKTFGIITVIQRTKKEQKGLSGLLQIELLVQPSHKDIWKSKDLHTITSFPQLRTTLIMLQLAILMLRSVQILIPPYEPCEELYQLLETHLHMLAHPSDKKQNTACFFLALLHHGGQLPTHLQTHYNTFFENPQDTRIHSAQNTNEAIANEVIEYMTLITKKNHARGGT